MNSKFEREPCRRSKAFMKLVKNSRAEHAAQAKIERFINMGGLFPKPHLSRKKFES